MADSKEKLKDYSAKDVNDNIAEVREARGTEASLADRLAAIEARLSTLENPT